MSDADLERLALLRALRAPLSDEQRHACGDALSGAIRTRLALLEQKVAVALEHLPAEIYDGDKGDGVFGALVCPFNEPGHFWKDGCPACTAAVEAEQEST